MEPQKSAAVDRDDELIVYFVQPVRFKSQESVSYVTEGVNGVSRVQVSPDYVVVGCRGWIYSVPRWNCVVGQELPGKPFPEPPPKHKKRGKR